MMPLAIAAMLQLHVVQYTATDSSTWYVNSVLIQGRTESILVDAGFFKRDVAREIEQVAATGTHLKAIFITHPHEDHYFGIDAFLARFPGTPVYLTAAGLTSYVVSSPKVYERFKKTVPDQVPDRLITPQALPGTTLTVDGQQVVIYPDEQGDVRDPANSFVWVPSLRTVIAGDIVFNQVHPWLANSDTVVRGRWHRSLDRIASLHPTAVIAGHKRPDAPDDPAVLSAMHRYLEDFDATRKTAADADALIATMKQRYPGYLATDILGFAAKAAYAPPK